MRIYCTLLVKDEADIIVSSLKKVLTWADEVFVIDNGSRDGTLEILNGLSPKIHVLGVFYEQFVEGLRSIPFNYINQSGMFPPADWWCRMDADEVYLDNPRDFLSKVPPQYSRVCTNTVEFVTLMDDGESLLSAESYKYFIPLDWSETRFFRNLTGLAWDKITSGEPNGIGAAYPERIKVLHFLFRSYDQIQNRISIRKQNRERTGIGWSNSDYENVDDLLTNYNKENRIPYQGQLVFKSTASNFLATPTAKFKNIIKIILYKLGAYR